MTEILSRISKYNVIFEKLGKSDRASMPIGNGETGLNVWVQGNGEIRFYIARTDALTELDRTVKLGMVKISLSPNPFSDVKPFMQELNLTDGYISILGGERGNKVEIKIFVDKESDCIYVSGESENRIEVRAQYVNWRTAYGKKLKVNGEISESPDKVIQKEREIVFYHKNEENFIQFLADLQSVGNHMDKIPDFLTDRIFGGIMSFHGNSAVSCNEGFVVENTNAFELRVTTHSEQIGDENAFTERIKKIHESLLPFDDAIRLTSSWWNKYWSDSWIFVEGDTKKEPEIKQEVLDAAVEKTYPLDENLSAVTRAYILTKWMMACCSNGNFPIYYNGMLFNLMPGGNEHFGVHNFGRSFTSIPLSEPDMEFNPDERSWCTEHLWQNLRLPYYSMAARGEYDRLKNLFRYFRNFWDLNRIRAKNFYGAKGQHNTEMTLTSGLQTAGIYGLNRTGLPAGYSHNRAGGAIDISPGLELINLMFEYYNYSEDSEFLINEILPYSKDLFLYVETRFKNRVNGKLVMEPLQSAETYRNTKNPVTVIAGLKACMENILTLPEELVDEYSYFKEFENIIPEIPLENYKDDKVIAPAEEYNSLRENCEPPEVYTIYPFKLYTHYKPSYNLALKTYEKSIGISGSFRPFVLGETPKFSSYSGWQYIGPVAALLSLEEDAKTILENNCSLTNPGYSFPVMWGPIYDGVPDTDHGANILSSLQLMVFQTDRDKIYVLPCVPVKWNISFRMHAPKNTVVECVYKNGKIESLNVSPKEREKDVVICIVDQI